MTAGRGGVSWASLSGLPIPWGVHGRVPAHAWPQGQGNEVDETPGSVGQLLETKCPHGYLAVVLL